jgi:hypothetical protein
MSRLGSRDSALFSMMASIRTDVIMRGTDSYARALEQVGPAHSDGSVRASVGDRSLGLQELNHAGAVVVHADVLISRNFEF